MKSKHFDFMTRCDPSKLLDILEREYPLIIAIVLSHLDTDKAAILLDNLPNEKKGEVARLIATMDRVSLEIVRGIEKSIRRKLSRSGTYTDFNGGAGIDFTVEVLKKVNPKTNDRVFFDIKGKDPELAAELQKCSLVTGGYLSENQINDLLADI